MLFRRIALWFFLSFAVVASSSADDKLAQLEAQIAQSNPGTEEYRERLVNLVRHCWYRCVDQASHYGDLALSEFAAKPNLDLEVLLIGYLPRIYMDTARYREAQEILDTVMQRGDKSPDLESWGRVVMNQAILYKITGQYLLAGELYQQALEIFQTLGNKGAVGNTYNNLALLSHDQDNLGQALHYYSLALPLVEEHASVGSQVTTLTNIATVYQDMRDETFAYRYLDRAEGLASEAELVKQKIHLKLRRASISFDFENYQDGQEAAQQALDLAMEAQALHHAGQALIELGDFANLQGETDQALDYFGRSLAIAEQIDSASLSNWAKLSLAGALVEAFEFEQAVPLLEDVRTSTQELGHDDKLRVANETLVLALEGLGRYQEALTLQTEFLDNLVEKNRADKENDLTQLATLFKQHEQRQTITELERDNAQKALEVNAERQAKQRVMFASIIVALLLLLLLGAAFQRRKMLQVQADLAQAMVERKNRMLSEISHELRTPLAAIKLQIEMLEHNLADSPEQTHQLLHSKIDSLNRLINDVFQLSKVDAGEMEFRFAPVAMGPFLRNWAQANAYLVENQGLTFNTHIDVADELVCECDLDRISQVLSNLLSNSCRYTDAPGQVDVHAYTRNDEFVLVIQDTSPGVDTADMEHLFERLFRADKSRNRESGGSGLGLAICQALISEHNGLISARPSELGGLSIRLVLPLKQNGR